MSATRNSILLGLALALSACGTENRGVESVHQPVVSRSDYVFDVAANDGLSGTEAQRLSGWFNSLKLGYGDHVAVDALGGYADPQTRDMIGALAARYGLLLDETAPVTSGEILPGSVRVVVSRLKATVPGCPDWSRPSQPEFKGSSVSNYGCATNTNLAGMVANPADLVIGQTAGSATSADSSSKAIKAYREAAPTGQSGLKKEGN